MRKNSKKLKFLFMIIAIVFIFIFQTIAYSSIFSTMTITGDAYTRVKTDVRITDFRLASTNNATSSYEEFGKNHVVTEVDLVNSSSSITYYVEITNYGSVDVGILDITGLPSGVNYSIEDYNLKDKICDDSGECNGFINKTYELTLTSTSSYTGSVQLNFDFRTYHKVSYVGITKDSTYPTEVMDGDDLRIEFTETLVAIAILSNGLEINYYPTTDFVRNLVEVENISSDIEVVSKIDEVGAKVCLDQDYECFYVISSTEDTVTLLSEYGLEFRNYRQVLNTEDHWCTPFSEYDHYGQDLSDYQQSIVKNWVDIYGETLTKLGYTPIEVRIITEVELEGLGCTYGQCSEAPEWVYYFNYWTSTPGRGIDNPLILAVYWEELEEVEYYNEDEIGVRPVVTILKSEL